MIAHYFTVLLKPFHFLMRNSHFFTLRWKFNPNPSSLRDNFWRKLDPINTNTSFRIGEKKTYSSKLPKIQRKNAFRPHCFKTLVKSIFKMLFLSVSINISNISNIMYPKYLTSFTEFFLGHTIPTFQALIRRLSIFN